MVTATLTSNLLRKELFWIAFALLFGGALVPNSVYIGALELEAVMSAIGGLLIMYLIVGSIIVILWTAYEGWRYGYAEGQINQS